MGTLTPRHVLIDGIKFRIDELAEIPFRRIADSLMVPRADISGAPGAINLQRDVWLWSMTDFGGGEGRLTFDSSDPLGPPAFYKTDGGVDVRVRGEFSLHPDEKLVTNPTGGGAAPTVTKWDDPTSGTGDFTTVTGTPEYSAGHASAHVRLSAGEKIRAPARTPGGVPVIRVTCRFVQARTTSSNKQVDVRFEVWNNTDTVVTTSATKSVKENEPVEIILTFQGVAGKTYHYRASNEDSGSVTVDVKHVVEETFATSPASPQDIRELRLGIGDSIWALAWDGSGTDLLRWDFVNDDWDQITGNFEASTPISMTGSDQYMYSIQSGGDVWRHHGTLGSTHYAHDPGTAGFAGTHGSAIGITVSNNYLWVLFEQGLFRLTLDLNAGLPLSSGADYQRVVSPGFYFREAAVDTSKRQHMAAISNGVRWFTNVRGEQATIWEYTTATEAATATHFLPAGYIITAMRHYANITFIAATFTNVAAAPAEKRVGIFFISSDNLLRFLGYLRFTETNSQDVAFITAYGHDVYFLQGRRIWRYNLGTGGITLENVTSQNDESKSRAIARMDKKFWVAVEGEGTFVADDAYSTTTMYMYSPIWDFDLPDMDKVLLSFDIVMAPLPSNTVVSLDYKIDESDAWTPAGTEAVDATVKTRFTVSTSTTTTKFRNIQWRCGLTSIDGVDTPRIRSVTTRVYVLDYEDSFDMTLLIEDDSSGERLISEQLSGRKKAERLWTIKNTKELVAFEDHYSSSKPGDFDPYTVILEDPFQETTTKGQSSIRLKLKVVS